MRSVKTVRWQRLDILGSERLELSETDQGRLLTGQVTLGKNDDEANIEYSVAADKSWITREVTVYCRQRNTSRTLHVLADGRGTWHQEGREITVVRGCLDVDLAFTPSTNTLPIRRLKLDIGKSARIVAAWLRYPELEWQILEQEYERLSEDFYEYRSRRGAFVAKLKVDEMGLVREYPGIWKSVKGESPKR